MSQPPDFDDLTEFFTHALQDFAASAAQYRTLYTLFDHNGDNRSQHDPTHSSSSHRKRRQQQLVILDSSFNPPTVAHAHMALDAVRNSPSPGSTTTTTSPSSSNILRRRLILLLAVRNADKPPSPASFPHRLAMMAAFACALSRKGLPADVAVDIAVTTEPYFPDKSAALALAEQGEMAAVAAGDVVVDNVSEQLWVLGYDTATRLLDEKYYGSEEAMSAQLDGYFARARVRVVKRDGGGGGGGGGDWAGEAEQEALVQGKGGRWQERIDIVEAFGGEVSSSKVRQGVGRGDEGVRDLVNEEVWKYISQNGLYERPESQGQ